jgi:hypothetical protein
MPFHHRLIEKDCMACHEDHEGSRLYHNAMRFSHDFLEPSARVDCKECHQNSSWAE